MAKNETYASASVLYILLNIWPIFSVSYKMIPIKAKSINIWLRYDPKWNLTIYKECGHEVGLHFGSYLSQIMMELASIWVIL